MCTIFASHPLTSYSQSSRDFASDCTLLIKSSHSFTHYSYRWSHLNARFLMLEIQVNLAWNKANKHGWINSILQSPPLAILWQNLKTNSKLNIWVWEQLQNSPTPNSKFVKLLNHMNKYLETTSNNDLIKFKVRGILKNAYGVSTMWSSKYEYDN